MTDFAVGDRVTLAGVPGKVNYINDGESFGTVDVRLDAYGRTIEYVPVALLARAPEPLKVGDVLTADSPEPPIGAVILDSDGHAWSHTGDGESGWRPPKGCEWVSDAWAFIAGDRMPATLIHLPA